MSGMRDRRTGLNGLRAKRDVSIHPFPFHQALLPALLPKERGDSSPSSLSLSSTDTLPSILGTSRDLFSLRPLQPLMRQATCLFSSSSIDSRAQLWSLHSHWITQSFLPSLFRPSFCLCLFWLAFRPVPAESFVFKQCIWCWTLSSHAHAHAISCCWYANFQISRMLHLPSSLPINSHHSATFSLQHV